jgi:trk system potassium uptake protein TrkA
MHIIIAGDGRLPYFLAKSFTSKGYRVTVIVSDIREAEDLAKRVKATILLGNASDPEVLRSADAYYCDLLIAVTAKDEDNLIISQLAKIEFGIGKTLALVNDPENLEVFQKLGCKAFSPTEMISGMIEQSVQVEDILTMFPTEDGKILLTELRINETSPVIDIPLREITRPDNSLLVSIVRGKAVIVPNGDSILHAGDRILVLSTPENHSSVIRMITGEEI